MFVSLFGLCLSVGLSYYCFHHALCFALFGHNELSDVNKLTKISNAVWPTDVHVFSL